MRLKALRRGILRRRLWLLLTDFYLQDDDDDMVLNIVPACDSLNTKACLPLLSSISQVKFFLNI